MGHYTFLRGTILLKSELVAALRPRFTWCDNRRDYQANWEQLALPEAVANDPRFETFIGMERAYALPGCLLADHESWGEAPLMELDEHGLLRFVAADKNYDGQQEAFIAMLPLIANEWHLEQDFSDDGQLRYLQEPTFLDPPGTKPYWVGGDPIKRFDHPAPGPTCA